MATNSDRRLGRLYGALSPKERAKLVLLAWRDGREPAKHLLVSRTDREAEEYNRIIDLMHSASDELTQYLTIIHLYAEQLEVKYSWYLTALLWGLDARGPEQMERAEDLADALIHTLAEGIALRWRELGALEAILSEIAAEVDGEDVLHAQARALFDNTRERLQTLHQDITARRGTCSLDPPSEEDVAVLRKLVR